MIELTGALQTVEPNQSVLFNESAVKSGCAERWREGSGQVTLTQPGRYLVTFSGNIAVPTGGTAGKFPLVLHYREKLCMAPSCVQLLQRRQSFSMYQRSTMLMCRGYAAVPVRAARQ